MTLAENRNAATRHEQAGATVVGSRQALDAVTLARTYPAETLPARGFAAAYAHTVLAAAPHKSAGQEAWKPLGPTNIGGRTLAIAFNPQNTNTILAGSASGGLWRSYSAGVGEEAWARVETGLPVLGVAAVAFAPNDSSVIYIGTGEVYGSPETYPGVGAVRTTRGTYGIGILKSSDGGQTWHKSLDWTLDQRRAVQKIRVNPLRPESVWAATTDGTFLSYDAGTSWTRVHDIVMATDLKINPVDTSVVFVANGGMNSPGHGLYRTRDGGQTWTQMPIGVDTFHGKAELAMSASDPNIVMASVGFSNGRLSGSPGFVEPKHWLVRTDDGGDTWRIVSTENISNIQGWYSHAVAIHPLDPDTVWAAGQSFSPFRSTAGGGGLRPVAELGMFEPVRPPEGISVLSTYPFLHWWADYHDIVFHPTDPRIIYFANDGGLFRSTDGGVTSENLNGGYQTTQFYAGFSVSRTDPEFALGGLQDNNTVAYDGTPHWRRFFGGDGGWTAIHPENDWTIYVSSQFGAVGRSRDAGETFELVRPDLARTDFNFIAPFVVSPVDGQTMYLGARTVYRSLDEGDTWHATNGGETLDGNNVLVIAASHQDAGTVYAATSPRVVRPHLFRTVDGGAEWLDVTGPLPDRLITDVAVDPNDDRRIFVTLGGFGSSHVFASTDGGDSWSDAGAGLPDIPTWSVAVDPRFPTHVYVGSDVGVYQSVDGGLSWSPTMDGLPEAVLAMDLVVSPASRELFVATHGNGVYARPLERTVTSAEDPPVASAEIVLSNFPNPFSDRTTIAFRLPAEAAVDISVHDLTGRLIRRLDARRRPAGTHEIAFDASGLAAGTYLIRLGTNGAVRVHAMTVVR